MLLELHIDNLLLSTENPRLTDSQNELEEIEKMIKDQQKKLVNLAEDICIYGLSPLDTVAVYPSEYEEDKFVVAEGNRRITAIKLINNPEIAKPFDNSVYSAFNRLKLKFSKIYIDKVPCYLFKSANDKYLKHWIEIKHLGENEGRGTASWSSLMKERWDKKITGESRLLNFWEELENNNILKGEEILKITKTNWERILRDYGLRYLNISKRENALIIPYDELDVFKSKIRKIYENLRDQTVAIVYDQEKIEQFYDQVNIELYGTPYKVKQPKLFLEEKADTINHYLQIDKKQDDNKKTEKDNDNKVNDIETKTYPSDVFLNSDTIIPKKYKFQSSNARINKIIEELKNLKVDLYPNACGALLRVLFELSAKYYLENITHEDQTETEFKIVINKVSKVLMDMGKLNKQDHSALSKDVDILRNLFNGYMHNTKTYPSSEAIKNIFKAHKNFLEACLQYK